MSGLAPDSPKVHDQLEKLVMDLPEAQRAALGARLLASVPGFLERLGQAPARVRGGEAADNHQWMYTFKVDASYHLNRKVAGIGIVIHASRSRDSNGPPMESIAELYDDVPAWAPEKLAILRALEIARERAYLEVKICSDCNDLRHLLREHIEKGEPKKDSKFTRNPLHRLIVERSRAFAGIRFPYHPRRKNQEAHKLARFAVRELQPKPCPATWAELVFREQTSRAVRNGPGKLARPESDGDDWIMQSSYPVDRDVHDIAPF